MCHNVCENSLETVESSGCVAETDLGPADVTVSCVLAVTSSVDHDELSGGSIVVVCMSVWDSVM